MLIILSDLQDSTKNFSLNLVNFNDDFAENLVVLDVMHSACNDPAYHRIQLANQKYSRNTIRVPLFDWVQLGTPHMLGIRFAVNWQQLKRFEKGSSAQEDIIHVCRKSYLTHSCSSILKTSSCWLFPAELELRHLPPSCTHHLLEAFQDRDWAGRSSYTWRCARGTTAEESLTATESLFLHKTSKQNKLS